MNEILADLLTKWKELRARPPIVNEIWFVDRPEEYWRCYQMVQDIEAATPSIFAGLFGIRLFITTVNEMATWTPEKLEYLKIPMQPGKWARMSDGSVQPFCEDKEDVPATR